MDVFVPFRQELLERYPELVGRLVPYRPGLPCAHQDRPPPQPREDDSGKPPFSRADAA